MGPTGTGMWPLGGTRWTEVAAAASARLIAVVPLGADGCGALVRRRATLRRGRAVGFRRFGCAVDIRHLYRMVVFESHGEYVTSHMFDITQQSPAPA